MHSRRFKILFAILSLFMVISYQDCAPQENFGVLPPSPIGNNTGTTAVALKAIQPTFAVRGMNCMACHGIIGSNIVTDFGISTTNFNPLYKALSGDANRSAYDNVSEGWQNMVVSGTVYVPHVAILAAQAKSDYGLTTGDTTLAALMQMPNVMGNAASMATGVTPAAGGKPVVELSSISIKYPSRQEILSLLPTASQANDVAVTAIDVQGIAASSQQGFGADPTNQYITNTSALVSCYGDVVVKGPLFLNNLNLQTDANGCRLYVSNAVFIQGPITYTGPVGRNLQISSASAVIMGFSTMQLGALQGPAPAGDVSTVRTNQRIPLDSTGKPYIVTVGSLYPRLSQYFDSNYNPSGEPINGVPSTTFFDNIVSDSLKIGAVLHDAGDAAALAAAALPNSGETIIHDPDSLQGNFGGQLVSVNYSGLLINAPQVHSRYAGSLSGVIIADVAMLARNPSSTAKVEQFVFDPVFNTAPVVLPALTTNILEIEQ